MNLSKLFSLFLAVGLIANVATAAKGKSCHFSDKAKLKTHLDTHVKYPIHGKELKAVCKKEWPDEFTTAEWKCFDKHIKNGSEYTSAADVEKALGVN